MKQNDNNEKPVIVTTSWDDGDNLDVKLADLLKKYGAKGTFYVSESYKAPVNGVPLEPYEIVELDKYHEIGSHTLTHPRLSQISIEEAKKEITNSKSNIEKILGHDIDMFCYPYGDYNAAVKQVVKNAGFKGARTTKNSSIRGDFNLPADPYEWEITLHGLNGMSRQIISMWKVNSLPLTALLDWEQRAKGLFDAASKKGGIFHIWSHSWELEQYHEWDKMERLLQYMSSKKNVRFLTNGEIMKLIK